MENYARKYDEALFQSIGHEMEPGFKEVEPMPLYGPDYCNWTFRELLFSGMLRLNYEGTPFVEMVQRWDRKGPFHEYLDPQNEHLLRLILSWKRIATKTPQDMGIFPKFPLKLKIDRHYNFSEE